MNDGTLIYNVHVYARAFVMGVLFSLCLFIACVLCT